MHTKLLKEHLMSLSLYVCMKVQEKIYIFFFLLDNTSKTDTG